MYRHSLKSAATAALVFLSRLAFAKDACNGPEYNGPVSIPLTNVPLMNLSNGETLSQFGAYLRVGRDEPQNFAMEINMVDNNVFLYSAEGDNPGSCENTTYENCYRFRGGLYERDESTGWSQVAKNDNDYVNGIKGTDSIYLGDLELPRYPLLVLNRFLMGGIGVTYDSTLIAALKSAGRITSNSWSVWFGQRPDADGEGEMDGHLIFGGQDEAKFSSESATWSIDNASKDICETGLVVDITQITAQRQDGTDFNLLDGDQPVSYCIVPGISLIGLSNDAYDRLVEEIASPVIQLYTFNDNDGDMGPMFNANGSYGGSIRFQMAQSGGNEDDVTFEMPNSQISIPRRWVGPDGDRFIEPSQRELLVAPYSTMPRLGHSFLRSAILTVNYEETTFTLTTANPSRERRLRPILREGDTCGFEDVDGTDPEPGAGPKADGAETVSGDDQTSQADGNNAKLSPAAIAAVSVGVFAGVVLIAFVAFCLFHRRRRAALTAAAQQRQDSDRGSPSFPDNYSTVERGGRSPEMAMGGNSPSGEPAYYDALGSRGGPGRYEAYAPPADRGFYEAYAPPAGPLCELSDGSSSSELRGCKPYVSELPSQETKTGRQLPEPAYYPDRRQARRSLLKPPLVAARMSPSAVPDPDKGGDRSSKP